MSSDSDIDNYIPNEPAANQILYEAYSRAPSHLILSPETVEIEETSTCEGGTSIIHRGRLLHHDGTFFDIAIKRLKPQERQIRIIAKVRN